MNQLITPSNKLGYSEIYLDFITGADKAKPFYPAGSITEVADQCDHLSYPREAIADILIEQNKAYNASEKTFANIERLRQPQTVTVFSGQQAGLFGGSLLILIKALALVKAAEQYEKELNRPVVPVFWIAGDDHDYEEVNHTFVLDRSSELVKTVYDTVPEVELPTAELMFSDKDALMNAKQTLKETLGDTDFTAELYELLDTCYTTDDTYVTAFGKLMAALTKEYGLVFFSPGDPSAKKLAVPFLKGIIEQADELHSRLNKANDQIEQTGYHLQVEKKDNSAHLFYNYNGRKPLSIENGTFSVEGKSFTKEELLTEIEAHPEKFSPDVITRPILQSYLFPVISQKGGAAEIAYLAQINQLFSLFNLPTPFYKARPTATIVEARYEKLMDEHDIKFEELVGDVEQLINRILEKSFPDNIEESFEKFRNHIRCHFEDFSEETLKFDPSLKNFSEQIMGKIDYNIKAFEGKVFSSHKKKSKQSRERIYKLWHSLYPNRSFQERVLNVAYFISKYGFGFVDFLYTKLDSEENAHQLITLSEYTT